MSKRKLTATVQDIVSWEPCPDYPESLVEELWAGRESLTAREILALDIPSRDRLWAVSRPELLPEKLLHEFACDVAEWALNRERKAGREPDKRSWKTVEVKRRWIEGRATDDEMDASRAAAGDASWDAALAAARAASSAAVRDAASAAFVKMLLVRMDKAGIA